MNKLLDKLAELRIDTVLIVGGLLGMISLLLCTIYQLPPAMTLTLSLSPFILVAVFQKKFSKVMDSHTLVIPYLHTFGYILLAVIFTILHVK